MSDTPYAIPLIELLKDVPIDGSDCYPISSVHHKNIPYGELCHAAAKEIEQLERERDEARKIIAATLSILPCGHIPSHTPESMPERIRELVESWVTAERERDEARADCERLNRLLRHETALGQGEIDHWAALERERDELKQKTGYWESLLHWLEQVQKAFEGKDRLWDLTQLYARGPFAGWSQERMVRLADELWENEQKYPLRGDKK